MANKSFLPEDFVEQRKQRRANGLTLVLFVVVMAGIVAAFLVTDRQRSEVRRLQQQVNDQFEEAAKRLEQLDRLQAQKERMFAKARVSAVLLERIPRTLILSELINRMPASLSLLEMSLNTKVLQGPPPVTALDRAKQQMQRDGSAAGPALPEIRPTEITLTMTGLAPTDVEVSQFMASLAQSPLVADQNLLFSREDTVDKVVVRRFQIDLVLNQDADVTAIEPLMVQRGLEQNPMDEQVHLAPAAAGPPAGLPAGR